jgi:hypothetical protein
MESVLDLYKRRYDRARPVVCIDEKPVQLREDVREPIPTASGRPRRTDHEYRRRGTANLFVVYEPLRGGRRIEATERRTKVDFAHLLKRVVDDDDPKAEEVQVVCDNLNIHDLSALFEAFATTEARRIARRVRLHKMPKHGSWRNMAEIERAAPPGLGGAPARDVGLAGAAQQPGCPLGLAVHHRRRSHPAPAPLSIC